MADDADRIARLERAVAYSLQWLQTGRVEEARRELEAVVEGASAAGHPGEVSEGELDRAFEGAEPVADELIDVNHVAQQVLREADREPEDVELGPHSAFATRTMAELLERQGDAEGASRIRAALAPDDPAGEAAGERRPGREEIIATLETWLENLRRETL